MTNLLKNAYLHTAEGGAVGVELRDRTLTVTNDGKGYGKRHPH